MRKLLLLLPLITLLTACQSKRETCARWSAGQLESAEVAKKFDIYLSDLKGARLEVSATKSRIRAYCSFYRD